MGRAYLVMSLSAMSLLFVTILVTSVMMFVARGDLAGARFRQRQCRGVQAGPGSRCGLRLHEMERLAVHSLGFLFSSKFII